MHTHRWVSVERSTLGAISTESTLKICICTTMVAKLGTRSGERRGYCGKQAPSGSENERAKECPPHAHEQERMQLVCDCFQQRGIGCQVSSRKKARRNRDGSSTVRDRIAWCRVSGRLSEQIGWFFRDREWVRVMVFGWVHFVYFSPVCDSLMLTSMGGGSNAVAYDWLRKPLASPHDFSRANTYIRTHHSSEDGSVCCCWMDGWWFQIRARRFCGSHLNISAGRSEARASRNVQLEQSLQQRFVVERR